MPTYVFRCENCNHSFELQYSIKKISGAHPKCSLCKKNKSVYRDYQAENVSHYDSTPRTVGTLAERNSKRLSDEAKTKQQRKIYTGPKPRKKHE